MSGGEEAVRGAVAAAAPAASASDDGLDLRLARFSRNDYGNARRLIERHGKDLVYVQAAGWHFWDGRRWQGDKEGERQAHLTAHKTALAIWDERKAVLATPENEMGGEKAKEALSSGLQKWAVASGNSARITAMLNEAAPYLQKAPHEVDADPYLFNVENGTLNLKAGVKRQRHRREDYITKLAPVRYDPDEAYPAFRTFLDEIMPAKAKGGANEEQAFLQRFAGYCLTGDISEEKILLCHGGGANGKSTFILALMQVYGEYATTLRFESLQYDGNKRGGEASPDLAKLPGRRFVYAPEPENNVTLSTSTVKRFTSKEPIQVRRLYQDETEFRAQFKLCLSFNPKPNVPSQDDGTWRRLMMMHFDQTIPDERKDPGLLEKLAAERSGILNWMLDGYRAWLEGRLRPPQSVLNETDEYRSENDPVGTFARHCLMPRAGAHTPAKDLYKAFVAWCEENNAAGQRVLSQKKFGTRMRELHFKSRTSGTTTYLDLELVDYAPRGENSSGSGGWRSHGDD